jgi:8-oxo-dGTP diphosphatase
MTPVTVTAELLHGLVAGSHAEGITTLAVAPAVDHDDRILLIVAPGRDFIDDDWELPAGPVLPGDTLTDALAKALAAVGLDIDEVTAYLGHHDHYDTDGELTRVFCFTVTVTDPHSICRSARIGHWWADSDDLPDLAAAAALHPATLAASWTPATRGARRGSEDPPLAGPLRACVRSLYAAEAAIELLIRHAAWLHRNDFCHRFVRTSTSITSNAGTAAIDWPAAITALDAGELPCSGSEAQMLRLAASLADGTPVNLRDTLTGLDSGNTDLVSRAVLHATGHKQQRLPSARSASF